MISKGQLGKWLIVFFFMSFFTFFQIPISQYALAIVQPNIAQAQSLTESTLSIDHSRKEMDGISEENNEENTGENTDQNTDENTGGITNEITDEEADENIDESSDDTEQNEQIMKKPVYLTIDDGPGAVSTKILDVLAKYEVSATFFLIEPRVRYYPDAVKRMVIEGHELGVHGVTHDVRKFYGSSQSAVGEFNKTRASMKNLTGNDYYLARTPYGSSPYLTQAQERLILEQGYKIWDWNVDSRDWYYRSERYVSNTIAQLKVLDQKGIIPIILIHELETTARHLPLLIEYLLANGYELKTLDLEDIPVRLR